MKPATDKSSMAIYAVWVAVIVLIVISSLTSGCGMIYGWGLMQRY